MIICESVFGNVFQFDTNEYIFDTVYTWCIPVNNDGYRYVICGPSTAVLTICGIDKNLYRLCNQQVNK
jgi:hypothetical protein